MNGLVATEGDDKQLAKWAWKGEGKLDNGKLDNGTLSY